MRVLTIAHNAVAASNRQRAEALASLPEVDVTLLTPRWWNEEGRRIDVPRSAAWRVGRTLFTGNGTRHVYVGGLVEAIRASKPDVIDLLEEPFSLVALQTLLLRDVFAASAAIVFYSAVNVAREWRLPYRWIERLTLRRADGAHAPSRDVPPILRAKGFARQPVSVIPLGVDVDRFECAAPMDLGSIPAPRIGFIGRLEPVKGLDVLLDAFDRLHDTGATLVVAGDGSLRPTLAARAEKTRIQLLGAVDYASVPSLLKALDVLVLPSVTIPPVHREQFGRVLVEAMAAGVPVIGSTSGGIPEVIGDAGLIVPERDPVALAEALLSVLNDGTRRRTLVERGHQRVEKRFAWRRIADQTVELFRAARAHRQAVSGRLREARA